MADPRTRCLSTTESRWMDPLVEGDPIQLVRMWSMYKHWVCGSELLNVDEVRSIQPTRRSLTISCNNGLSKVNLLWIVCTLLWTIFKATKLSIEKVQLTKLDRLEYYVTLTVPLAYYIEIYFSASYYTKNIFFRVKVYFQYIFSACGEQNIYYK